MMAEENEDFSEDDRAEMLKAFDETHAGVKGLVDSGILRVPKIFIRPSEEQEEEWNHRNAQIQVPVIDLGDILHDSDRRKQIVEQVRTASETWGFFQVVNHGIPQNVLDGMIDGVRRFHETDVEEKSRYYTRDYRNRVKYHSNYDLFTSKTANWRDTLSISFSDQVCGDGLPDSCRDTTVEYFKHVAVVGDTLFSLLSEALGLRPDHLRDMKCSKGYRFSSHYYPACPEPQLTMGTTQHSDPGFLTILLQNHINGLQVFHQGQWIGVEPIPGGLVINIADLLQVDGTGDIAGKYNRKSNGLLIDNLLVSNGRFRSSVHRVVANSIGPRISVACFISGPVTDPVKYYGPIRELISEHNPAKYKELLLTEYLLKFLNTGLDVNRGLDHYKL